MAKILVITLFAMIAFAANSILCRAALKPSDSVDTVIDPASYTVIRIVAGACVLFLIQVWRRKPTFRNPSQNTRWLSPLMLSGYAVGFSFAYIGLDTASGTLILFAFVQLTMIVIGILRKEFPRSLEIAGLILASTGLVYLVFPHLQTPLFKESLLMAIAGISWGVYSVLGKGSTDSISDTAFNFVTAAPLVVAISLFFLPSWSLPLRGVILAALSGGIASGLGYVLWYVVLPSLRSTQAAAVQLSVPIIATLGGVWFVGDELNQRIVASGMMILIGIGFTIKWNGPKQKPSSSSN